MSKKFYYHKEEIQIVFKSDPELKDAALEKAKHEGMTLKAVLCMAMKAYVNDEMVLGMWRNEEYYEGDDEASSEEKSPPKKKIKAKDESKKTIRVKPSSKKKTHT
jgi:hypothetical protein